jgi:hypothetical protein
MGGNGKSNPFNPDGKSGADGNSGGGKQSGIANQRGPDRPQKMGPDGFNPDSVPDGGRILKIDPPSDRGGLVNQTAGVDSTGMKHKPYKVGGGSTTPPKNADVSEGGPVGDVPVDPTPDTGE